MRRFFCFFSFFFFLRLFSLSESELLLLELELLEDEDEEERDLFFRLPFLVELFLSTLLDSDLDVQRSNWILVFNMDFDRCHINNRESSIKHHT